MSNPQLVGILVLGAMAVLLFVGILGSIRDAMAGVRGEIRDQNKSWLLGDEGKALMTRGVVASEALVAKERPLDILLLCPVCHVAHIDAPEPSTGWTNPPHKSHKCHHCSTVWRPADHPTNGVAAIHTRGHADTWKPS